MPRGVCNYEPCDKIVSFDPHPMYGKQVQFWCCEEHRVKDNHGLESAGNIRGKKKGKGWRDPN